MSFAMVLDQALIGWLRAIQQMCRNMLFSVLKLVLLVAVVTVGVAGILGHEVVILATWVFGQLAATIIFVVWLLAEDKLFGTSRNLVNCAVGSGKCSATISSTR